MYNAFLFVQVTHHMLLRMQAIQKVFFPAVIQDLFQYDSWIIISRNSNRSIGTLEKPSQGLCVILNVLKIRFG